MRKRLVSLLMTMVVMCTCAFVVSAKEAITSDTFTLYVDVALPEGELVPSTLRFNIFTEDGEWLSNQFADINKTGRLTFVFPVPTYEIGEKFIMKATTGATHITYYEDNYGLGEEFIVETYAYHNANGELIVTDDAYVTACPLYETWEEKAESFVNGKQIKSDTSYMIWVSKAKFTVSVFLKEEGQWNCIKYFPCSIGAPGTPTVTGEFKYYQYQKKWDYGSYYVGPIMRFYGGYAIHSTLVNNNGTDRDGRVGKMISHGCVRVRPENINWLTYYIPLGTKIYITNN